MQEIKLNSTEFQPRSEYILVKPELPDDEAKTQSGIIIGTAKKSPTNRPMSGTVIAVGCAIQDIKEGDYVIYPNTDGLDLKFLDSDPAIEEAQFVLLRDKSVLGKRKIG